MQDLSLGINTGFAVNRYPLASEWLNIIELIKLKKVQITADVLDPRNPQNFIDSEIEYINDKSKVVVLLLSQLSLVLSQDLIYLDILTKMYVNIGLIGIKTL